MCNIKCIDFGRQNLKEEDVKGKDVIEVGSYDVNGSYRSIVQLLGPASYLGVDMKKGPGVDEVCDADDLLEHFGTETFDLLISTEVIEHVRDWRRVISVFKHILKPNGVLLITTRSMGFKYHGWPYDFWRYEIEDFRNIFSDFSIERLEKDTSEPGVLIKAKKPASFLENDLSDYKLYSIIRGKRIKDAVAIDIWLAIVFSFLPKVIPTFLRERIKYRIR